MRAITKGLANAEEQTGSVVSVMATGGLVGQSDSTADWAGMVEQGEQGLSDERGGAASGGASGRAERGGASGRAEQSGKVSARKAKIA
jgi:hypothetical protein